MSHGSCVCESQAVDSGSVLGVRARCSWRGLLQSVRRSLDFALGYAAADKESSLLAPELGQLVVVLVRSAFIRVRRRVRASRQGRIPRYFANPVARLVRASC